MKRIAILTDSSAAIPLEWAEQYNIHTLPLKLLWGKETLQDGVDITPTEFYNRLEQDPLAPTTSQPTPQEFLNEFERLSQEADGILVAVLSSGISGTYDSATMAAKNFDKIPVAVLDTRSTCSGLAFCVLAGARAAQATGDLTAARNAAQAVANKLDIFFLVNTLKFLHRGGRIGGAARLLGSVLSIKPVLALIDGKIEAVEKVRTRQKSLERLAELIGEKAAGKPVRLGVFHANCLAEADYVSGLLKSRLEVVECYTYDLSPVIGSHVGPGTLGVAVYSE